MVGREAATPKALVLRGLGGGDDRNNRRGEGARRGCGRPSSRKNGAIFLRVHSEGRVFGLMSSTIENIEVVRDNSVYHCSQW